MTAATQYGQQYRPQPRKQQASPSLLAPTAGFLALAFGISAVVGFIFGPLIPPAMTLPISIGVTVLLLASVLLRKIPGFSYILLVVIPSAIGLMLYPIIATTIAQGQASVVTFAFVGTFLIFSVTAVVAWFTEKTIYRVSGVLFGITLAIIAISLLNTFLFHLSVLSVIISIAVVIVFTIWTFIDIQTIRDGLAKPVDMALNVFIDIVNIFLSLLNIARSFNN